jgi:DNA repair protein RecO (recombination protein O)
MEYKYEGIILGKKDVGETDRIYSIFTLEKGKIRVLAKSVRKANAKLAGFLENFNLAEIFIAKNQGMGKITGAIVLENFSSIRENFDATKVVFESLFFLDKFIKEDHEDREVFRLLKQYLETIDDLSKENNLEKIEIVFLGFTFKFFEKMGYRIEVNSCSNCGKAIKEKKNFFSFEQGGVICDECLIEIKENFFISPNAVKVIRIFYQNSLRSLKKLKIDKKDVINLKMIIDGFSKWIS